MGRRRPARWAAILALTPLLVAAADPLSGAFDFESEPRMEKLILDYRDDCPYGTFE